MRVGRAANEINQPPSSKLNQETLSLPLTTAQHEGAEVASHQRQKPPRSAGTSALLPSHVVVAAAEAGAAVAAAVHR